MRHRDATELLGAYLDGELDAAQRATVAGHLSECRSCEAALVSLRQVSDRLQFWLAPSRIADEELAFIMQLVQTLPARSTTRLPVRRERRSLAGLHSYLLPAGLVLSSAFIQATAILTVVLGILVTSGMFSSFESRLNQILQGASGMATGSLTQCTWIGWIWSQVSTMLGPRSTTVFAWFDWLLGGVVPTIVFGAFLFVILIVLTGWMGLHLQDEDAGRPQLPVRDA
jgi:anti-sigma factor RsiW